MVYLAGHSKILRLNEKRKLAQEASFLIPARGRQNIIPIYRTMTQLVFSFKVNMISSNFEIRIELFMTTKDLFDQKIFFLLRPAHF